MQLALVHETEKTVNLLINEKISDVMISCFKTAYFSLIYYTIIGENISRWRLRINSNTRF